MLLALSAHPDTSRVQPFTSNISYGVKVLEFPATNTTQVPYIIDFCGLEDNCEAFVAKTKRRDDLKRHFVIHGLVKSGKSTVLMRVLPAVVRRHYPDALFWDYEVSLVSVYAAS
jgi:hypothetical protein